MADADSDAGDDYYEVLQISPKAEPERSTGCFAFLHSVSTPITRKRATTPGFG